MKETYIHSNNFQQIFSLVDHMVRKTGNT